MGSFLGSIGFALLYLTAVFAIFAVSFLFRSRFRSLFPSMIYDAEDIQKILHWSTRIYYIYSILLNLAIQAVIRFNLQIDLTFFVFPIIIQAALLLHTFQTYRRFFTLSPEVRNNFLLRLGFFFWLLFILLLGIEQIVRFPLFFGGLMVVLTGNENFASPESNAYLLFVNILFVMLGVSGEYLLKKILPKQRFFSNDF